MFPRRVQCSDGSWLSYKQAEKLYRRGKARWHGPIVEVITELTPPRPQEIVNITDRMETPGHPDYARDQVWIDLRRVVPVWVNDAN